MTVPIYPEPSTVLWRFGGRVYGSHYYSVLSSAAGQTGHVIFACKLFPIQTGRLTFQNIVGAVSFYSTVNFDFLGFMFFQVNEATSQLTPVVLSNGLPYYDLTTQMPSSQNFTCTIPNITADVYSSLTYAYGLIVRKCVALVPGLGFRSATNIGYDQGVYYVGSTAYSTQLMPSAYSTTFTVTKEYGVGGLGLWFNFNKLKLMSVSPTTGYNSLIPYSSNAKIWMKLNNVNLDTSQYCQVLFHTLLGTSNSSIVLSNTFRIDMGSTDYIQYSGNQIALNAVTPEINNNIDVGIYFDTNRTNCFWQNCSIGQND